MRVVEIVEVIGVGRGGDCKLRSGWPADEVVITGWVGVGRMISFDGAVVAVARRGGVGSKMVTCAVSGSDPGSNAVLCSVV